MRKSFLSPLPSSPYFLCLLRFSTQSLQPHSDVLSVLQVWPQAEQFSHCKGECIFAWKTSSWPSDLLGGRTSALAHKLLCIRSLGPTWQFIPIWTQSQVWTWMFTGLFAFDQGCLGADNYGTRGFLTFLLKRYSCFMLYIQNYLHHHKNSSSRAIP